MKTIINTDKQYKEWLIEIKKKIQVGQIKAAIRVNQELLNTYWELGKEITVKQQQANWGDALIDQLSKDLAAAFPGVKGFSRANLFFIRKWYLFYHKGHEKAQQGVAPFSADPTNAGQPEKVQQLVRQIPWGHNVFDLAP